MSTFFSSQDQERALPEQLIERAKCEGTVTDEALRVRKDDSQFWATLTISASYDDSGTLRGFAETIQERSKPTIST